MKKEYRTLAVITARGGSKRIPRKNVKDFCGKPIIKYSIEAALKSNLFDEVMVSTDDKEIADISIESGASVPFMRSEKTSNDYATTRDVLIEVLEKYKEIGKEYDYLVCLYPTNPFITSNKIEEALNILIKEQCEEVVPVVRFSFPPQRAYIMDESKSLKYKWEEYKDIRSQDLQAFYHDAGQFYCYNIEQYLRDNGHIKGRVCPIILQEYEVQDIDNDADWKMAELKYTYLKEGN